MINPMMKLAIDAKFGPVRPELYGAPGGAGGGSNVITPGAPLPTGPGQQPMSPFGQEWLLRKTTDGDAL